MNVIALSFLIILIFDIIKWQYVLECFQQNLYNEEHKYVNWIFQNKKIVFFSLDFLSLLCLLVVWLSKSKLSILIIMLAWCFYFLEICRILTLRKMRGSRKNLILSKKVKRLIITQTLFYIFPLILYFINYEYGYFALILEGLFSYLAYYLVWFVKIINTPLEKIIHNYHLEMAKEKMKKIHDLKVVGITGTYGKSSTKQIINTILSEKYLCQTTPKNLNTLHGLITTINNFLEEKEKVFIVEMGSYKIGEVNTICELAKPRYAILTNIEATSLDSFDTMENSVKAKFELVESLPPEGVAILNKDDRFQVDYVNQNDCKKIWISLEQEADYTASKIKYSKEGTKFILSERRTGKSYPVESRLLGRHNVYHILSAIALAKELGVSDESIKAAISKLRPLENHLEIRNFGYMQQINNTHRSNPQGAKNALDVLGLMPGERVVVTTGMQTLGEKGAEFNNIFGSQVAKVADYVILVGEKSTKSVFKGLMESGFNQKKVYIVNRVRDAYTLLQEIKTKKEIYALFESDDDLKD